MSQKKFKALRKEALQIAVEQGLPYVDYSFKQYKKVYVDLLGKPQVYTVSTVSLGECQKKIYKQLKKEFANSK